MTKSVSGKMTSAASDLKVGWKIRTMLMTGEVVKKPYVNERGNLTFVLRESNMTETVIEFSNEVDPIIQVLDDTVKPPKPKKKKPGTVKMGKPLPRSAFPRRTPR